MKTRSLKLFALSILSCCAMTSTSVFAEDAHEAHHKADHNIEVTPQISTTKEELAAIQVLSEICPSIIGKNANFDKGYNRLVADNLPNFSNPRAALNALSQQTEFQTYLTQARKDAKAVSNEQNRQVCLDVISY